MGATIRRLIPILALLYLFIPSCVRGQVFVQYNAGGTICNSYGTGTCSFAGNNTGGNTIISHVLCTGSCPVSVSDSKGNIHTLVASCDFVGLSGYTLEDFEADSIAAGSNVITVTAAAGWYAWITEYSGLSASAFDQTSCNYGSTAGSTTATSNNTSTTSQAKELLTGSFYGSASPTAGSGFTLRAGTNSLAIEDQNVTSTGTYAATLGGYGNYVAFIAMITTFKAAGAAPSKTCTISLLGAGPC